MSATVTRTKVIIPRRRSDLLSRSRLISVFDDVLDYPYTLISAPAGYGKTSLMIDLAHQANYPVCWFTTDPLDLDPNRFLSHLVQSIRIQFPTFGSEALSLLENQANPLQNPAQVVRILTNEIYQTISEHFVIFIDDFHNLNSDKDICSFISQFGQEMDDNTHLVMASRTLFDFPDLTLLIGRRQVKGIGFDELAFQTSEIKSYYRDILHREITDKETETLLDRTEGWITGLVFSVDTDLAHLPGSGKKGRITGADLFQYLAEQVFDKQPPALQDFLLRSSLLEEFNSDFCDLVLGRSDTDSWSTLIFDLQQKNLFVQQVEDEDAWIRYHALFRDFLRARFHDRFPEDEIKIYTRLLDIYLASGSWENAFAAAKQIGSPALMADVIKQANTTLIHQGRMKLLSSWLEQLPNASFETMPSLSILHGISFTSLGKPLRGLSIINKIINKSYVANNPKMYIRALLCRITTYRMLGRYDDVFSDIEYIFKESLSEDVPQKLLAETYREAALAHMNAGEYSISKKYFVQSINCYINLGDDNNQALAHQDLGLLLMEHGLYNEASQHFAIALETWKTTNNIINLANIYNNLGTLSILSGNYSESSKLLQTSLAYSEISADSRMRAFALASLGDLAKSISLLGFSLEKYKLANSLSERIQEGFLLSYLALNMSTILRYLGRHEKSKALLQVARTHISQGSSQNELGLWNTENGFQQLVAKDYISAQKSFIKAEAIFSKMDKPSELAKVRMGLILVCNHLSKPRLFQQHIKTWITSLVQLETNIPLLPELHYQGQRLAESLNNIPTNPALETILADLSDYRHHLPLLQKEIFPDQSTDPLRAEYLEIFALGKNTVTKQGTKIDSPEWIYQKTVRELFFYLLTLPRGATKEQIGLIFWPDSSPSQLTCQFKNTVYRLRRSIGRDAILYDPETRAYAFNRSQSYSFDVEDFQSMVQKAEQGDPNLDRIDYYQKAVELYNHPYSPQLGGVWAEPIRQSLSLKYEQALLAIAEDKLNKNQNQDCLEYCHKILLIEPCQEQAYQFSLQACANTNNRIRLIRVYKKCQNNLSKYLNITPSKATTSLYKKLLD